MKRKKKRVADFERIFEYDEMALRPVHASWTPEELLVQEGIFFLKDVAKVIDLDPVKIKKKARELARKGQSVWAVMGARKIWNHWILRMTVFAPYYREHLYSGIRSVDPAWNGNRLLEEKGIFYLTEVCKILPFSTNQLRYRAKKHNRSREEIGIWKDTGLNAFLVDMDRFAPWIADLWSGDFGRSGRP